MQGERPAKANRAAASSGGGSARTMAKRQRGLMVHQLPAGGVAAGRDRMTAVKGTRVRFPQGNTTRPLTDGKPERQEKQGAFDYGGVGAKFALISKCL